MKIKKQSQKISTNKELMPPSKGHEESEVIDGDDFNARASFKSSPWTETCKDVRCQIFGIMCLVMSMIWSLCVTVFILSRNNSTCKFLIIEIEFLKNRCKFNVSKTNIIFFLQLMEHQTSKAACYRPLQTLNYQTTLHGWEMKLVLLARSKTLEITR